MNTLQISAACDCVHVSPQWASAFVSAFCQDPSGHALKLQRTTVSIGMSLPSAIAGCLASSSTACGSSELSDDALELQRTIVSIAV